VADCPAACSSSSSLAGWLHSSYQACLSSGSLPGSNDCLLLQPMWLTAGLPAWQHAGQPAAVAITLAS